MTIVKRLIAETPNFEYDTIFEEANLQQAPKLYISGPFFQYGVVNKNKRMYQEDDMIREVKRYIAEDIAENRAGGELEHSSAPSLDLRNMADRILELKQEGNTFYGKSLVLNTPNGVILRNLIEGGVRIGRSTRALGSISENRNGVNVVDGFNLIAVDSVASPSMANAWVNGILESKEFICNSDGRYEESFDRFEKGLSKYPSKYKTEINEFLYEHVVKILKSFK